MVVHSLGRNVGDVTAIRISDPYGKRHAKRKTSVTDDRHVGENSHFNTSAVSVRVGVVPLLCAYIPKALVLERGGTNLSP